MSRAAGKARTVGSEGGPPQQCGGPTRLFLAYAASRGRTLIDRRLYLPTSWTDDRDRCRLAGIDDTIGFETKVVMAKTMVRRAIADRIPFRWVTADAATASPRAGGPSLSRPVSSTSWPPPDMTPSLPAGLSTTPSTTCLPGLPRQKWKRRSCGNGAHGPRVFDWARVEVRPWHRPDRQHWVIARRSVGRPEEVSRYIAYCPAGTTLDELIRIAGSRWAVEECFQTAKGECGLDDYQVRRYPGWHRHMTLAMAAHACLTVLRARELDTEKAETDHRRPAPIDHVLHWSHWRRRRHWAEAVGLRNSHVVRQLRAHGITPDMLEERIDGVIASCRLRSGERVGSIIGALLAVTRHGDMASQSVLPRLTRRASRREPSLPRGSRAAKDA
ncbi:IS701 family transposase [Streptomyces formicae]|uniref:IS701 family transposase n=1 Tax=Streptomyces formicae TaxID=1616117 RepID=UPI003BB71506